MNDGTYEIDHARARVHPEHSWVQRIGGKLKYVTRDEAVKEIQSWDWSREVKSMT